LAGDRHRRDALLLAEVPHPGCARLGVGEVGLVEDLQAGALPVLAQALDERVAARAGEAGVEDLDHDIDLRHRLGRLLAGGGHVAGKPFDGHVYIVAPRLPNTETHVIKFYYSTAPNPMKVALCLEE